MKDAIGGSSLLYLVVIFTSIIILFFVGIIAYSKAYKVKNRIIEVIEKNEGYDVNVANSLTSDLKSAGYRTATEEQVIAKCKGGLTVDPGFLYCVYEDTHADGSKSYEVVTYIHFDFPVVGDVLVFPVRGETKILGKSYNY